MEILFQEAVISHPPILLLSGMPGVGKSTLIQGLNKNGYKALHLDMQNGAKGVGGYILSLPDYMIKHNLNAARAWRQIMKELKTQVIESGDYVYDFLVIDPLSNIKDIIPGIAAAYASISPMGKAFAKKQAEEKYGKPTTAQIASCHSKDPVADFGQNGWNFYGMAWQEVFQDIRSVAPNLIVLSHTRYSAFKKSETSPDLNVKEIDFWPKFTQELVREASDSAYVYRKGFQVIANFTLNEETPSFKTRHFPEGEIILSELVDKQVVTYMEKIYPFLSTPKPVSK